jgi:hypothetical protein
MAAVLWMLRCAVLMMLCCAPAGARQPGAARRLCFECCGALRCAVLMMLCCAVPLQEHGSPVKPAEDEWGAEVHALQANNLKVSLLALGLVLESRAACPRFARGSRPAGPCFARGSRPACPRLGLKSGLLSHPLLSLPSLLVKPRLLARPRLGKPNSCARADSRCCTSLLWQRPVCGKPLCLPPSDGVISARPGLQRGSLPFSSSYLLLWY